MAEEITEPAVAELEITEMEIHPASEIEISYKIEPNEDLAYLHLDENDNIVSADVFNIVDKNVSIVLDTELDTLFISRMTVISELEASTEECVDCDLELNVASAEIEPVTNSGLELLTLGAQLNTARLASIEPEFGGIITLAGIPSSDGRFIMQGALDMRQMPLPLLMKTVKGGVGHEGAILAGVWSSMSVESYEGFDALWGEGNFTNTAAGKEAKKLLDGGHMRGISVDFDQIEYETTEDEMGNEQLTFTYARAAGACYDEETEILTEKRGWIKFAEVTPGDRVATKNQETDAFEWQSTTGAVIKDWTGKDMIRFTSGADARSEDPKVTSRNSHKTVDLLVTPNHRMHVRKTYSGESMFMTAEEMLDASNRSYSFMTTSEWEGEDLEYVYLQSNPIRETGAQPKDHTVDGDWYAAFMGGRLSEGSKEHKGAMIAQQRQSKGRELYEASYLNNDNFHCRADHRGFFFNSTALKDHLVPFGTAREKYVPDSIKNMSQRQLKIFFDHYMAGDGSSDGRRIYTSSEKMAGDLQEIAQKLGMWARIVEREYSHTEIDGRVLANNGPRWIVNLRNYKKDSPAKTVSGWKAERVTGYEGDVYCVSVPNETLYVRRNGTPAWCGNTFLSMPAFEEAFIAPIIKPADDALVASGGNNYSPVASIVFALSDFKELMEG